MASLDGVTPQVPQHEKVISRPYKCPYPLCGRAFSRLEHQVCAPHYMRCHEAQAPGFVGFLHRHHVTCRHLPLPLAVQREHLLISLSPILDSPHSHAYRRKTILLCIPRMRKALLPLR
jgi:hypothetical protein